MSHPKYPHIFEPIKIGNVVFKNRIWSAPAGVHLLYGREEYPSDAAVKYYAAKAAGGCAVIAGHLPDFLKPQSGLELTAIETYLNTL